MTGEHFSLASDSIRTITRLCREIDYLTLAGEPERAAKAARAFAAALRAASVKLSAIQLESPQLAKAKRATRWQGAPMKPNHGQMR